jgi:hypothetical protein
MKNDWFKVVFAIIGLAVVVWLFMFHDKQVATNNKTEAFHICMDTIQAEVLRNAEALKANLTLCKEISENF